jgi:hypothetical protein
MKAKAVHALRSLPLEVVEEVLALEAGQVLGESAKKYMAGAVAREVEGCLGGLLEELGRWF